MPELPQLPPIADQPISVVLLGGASGPDLPDVVAGWAAHLAGLGRDTELIVALADGAREAELTGRVPGVIVAVAEGGKAGDGAGLRAALPLARHPLLLVVPADPAYRPAHLDALLGRPSSLTPSSAAAGSREIDHVHIVSGFRAGRRVPLPLRAAGLLWRVFCRVVFSYSPAPLPGWLGWRGHLGWVVVRVVFALRTRDVLCPARLFRREVFTRIPIQSDGRFAHIEVLAKANFLGRLMAEEVPLDVTARPAGDGAELWREGYRVFDRPDFGTAQQAGLASGGEAATPGPPPAADLPTPELPA